MNILFDKFSKFIEDNKLLERREKVILGISGGPDSVFLFHMLVEFSKNNRNLIVAAHFNHQLRSESDQEEEFVRTLCETHNVRFVSDTKDVRKFFKGDSLEQTARNLRLDFFLKVSRKLKIKKVALAHHKDDLIETVLLRLVRGSGLLGLRGLLPIRRYKKILLIRPLLFIEKKDILKALKQNNLKYVLDKSNFQDKFLRNKIRLHLMPSILKVSPSFKENVYSLSKNISWDYDFIYEQARIIQQNAIVLQQPHFVELNSRKMSGIHRSLLNNLIRITIEQVKGSLRRIESKHIEDIVGLLEDMPVGSVVDIPLVKIVKKPNSLLFKRII